jgi:hypothetical protein
MAATPRPRTLEGRVEARATACVEDSHGIRLPPCLVEVHRQEETGLVEQKRVHAGDERLSRIVPSL